MRVVFDVNVLVRFAMRSELVAKIIRRVADDGSQILVSQALLDEFDLTIGKPDFRVD